jgi:hypothetical protein
VLLLVVLSCAAVGAQSARPSQGAGKQARPPPFPAAEVAQTTARWTFLVFHGAPRDPALGKTAPFHVVTTMDPKGPLPRLKSQGVPSSEVPPPDRTVAEQLGRGLNRKDLDRLQTLSRTLFLGFEANVDSGRTALKASQELVLRIAREAKGYIYDAESGELFSVAAFESRRVTSWKDAVPAAPDQVVVGQSVGAHPPLIRSVTLGMRKLGLPDLVIEDAADADLASGLINLAAQRLVEGVRPDREGNLVLDVDAIANPRVKALIAVNFKEGARHRSSVLAVKGHPDEGDPENALLELWFGGTDVAQREMVRVYGEIWGATDSVVRVKDDSELEAVSARARKHVLEVLKPRFADGKQESDKLLVKVPFRRPTGGNEWMWMMVLRWDGSTVKGILANDGIDVPQLKAGTRVEADERKIFDYILEHADGSREGNETAPLLMRASGH